MSEDFGTGMSGPFFLTTEFVRAHAPSLVGCATPYFSDRSPSSVPTADKEIWACEARIVRLVEDAAKLRAKNRAFRGYDAQIREAEEALAKEGDRLVALRAQTGGP